MIFETTVNEVLTRAPDVKSFRFLKPAQFSYKAGQFMFITIRKGEEELRKHFTISSSPTEEFLEFTKKLTDSEFSAALGSISPGDWTGIEGPFGKFTFEKEFEKSAMVAGGIGITPMRSMIKYCYDTSMPSEIVLLHACRTEKDLVFREELESIQKQRSNIRVVYCLSEPSPGWKGYTGRIDASMIEKEIPDYKKRMVYVCGPPPMVETMEHLLREMKVPVQNIMREQFMGYQ
jgi:ferredoxin-NADP reductase